MFFVAGQGSSAPAPQQKRLTAYLDWLALAVGHADRREPLRQYCTGLLLDGERKSIEPMAARLAPGEVQRMHESLHHFVAKSGWSDEAVLRQVRSHVLAAMQKRGAVTAWIVDETGFVKWGRHSVGVARQYCGRVGKRENCQVAVSLSVCTESGSLPIAWRLYLPESWTGDEERRQAAGIPTQVAFQTKPQIALAQIQQAAEEDVPRGVVLADSVYGSDREFREGVAQLQMRYAVGVKSTTTVWGLKRRPLPPAPPRGGRRAAQRLRRDRDHQPYTAEELARALPSEDWRSVGWREGSKEQLRSRFVAVWVRPAYGDDRKIGVQPKQWLLIEWPERSAEPIGYWLLNFPRDTKLEALVAITKQRWMVERDYEELKQEVGLSHYEGRSWRGFHHHVTLCIAAYGFLVAERSRFSPSARVGHLGLRPARLPPHFQPRGSARSRSTT